MWIDLLTPDAIMPMLEISPAQALVGIEKKALL
jgi:hypothetical protein